MSKTDQMEWALLILRLVLGSVFILHGVQKVFGWFEGPGLEGFAGFLQPLNVPVWLAHTASFFELIGGMLIFFGIATELGAILALPVMIGAVYLVHWEHGYFIQNNGYEYALNLVLLLIALIIGGPGKLALYDPFKDLRKTYVHAYKK